MVAKHNRVAVANDHNDTCISIVLREKHVLILISGQITLKVISFYHQLLLVISAELYFET